MRCECKPRPRLEPKLLFFREFEIDTPCPGWRRGGACPPPFPLNHIYFNHLEDTLIGEPLTNTRDHSSIREARLQPTCANRHVCKSPCVQSSRWSIIALSGGSFYLFCDKFSACEIVNVFVKSSRSFGSTAANRRHNEAHRSDICQLSTTTQLHVPTIFPIIFCYKQPAFKHNVSNVPNIRVFFKLSQRS